MEVKEKVELQLTRAEEEAKRLAQIWEEKEYKEVQDIFNEKSNEKAQLLATLMELLGQSEKWRMKKLEELNKNIESMN
ncbi:hypothetical protein Csa_018227 [Cucumis sativus]|nr:hypothetical protein Csa_018227 [Cucumis sativus]